MHTIRESLYYLWKKAAERHTRTNYNLNYEIDIERFNKCDVNDKKSASQMKQEQKILHKYWGCKPLHYVYYDFYRKDCEVTIDEMLKYIPDYFIFNLVFPRSYKDYGILCEDKGLTYATLKGYELAQPTMLLRFDFDRFYDETNGPISKQKVNEIINNSKAEKLFVKPSFGLGGKGIIVFNKNNKEYLNEDNVKLTHDYLVKEVNDGSYIIQEGVVQGAEMNKLYPKAVNTYRLVTECINGESKLLFALLRMGRGGGQIDNASSGGMYIKVDPETGKMHDFAFSRNRNKFYKHPDTDFIFKDAKFENWDEVKAFILVAAQKFRDIKYLGWDIACSENGPLIIEINNGPGINIVQDFYGGIRDVLKINPKDWWYNSKFTIKEL